MCMKKFDAEKNIFWQTYGVFNFSDDWTYKLLLIVHTLWYQLLLEDFVHI